MSCSLRQGKPSTCLQQLSNPYCTWRERQTPPSQSQINAPELTKITRTTKPTVGIKLPGNTAGAEWLGSLYANSSAGRVVGYIPGENWEKMKAQAVSLAVPNQLGHMWESVAYDGGYDTGILMNKP